jgi:hypothetical protein
MKIMTLTMFIMLMTIQPLVSFIGLINTCLKKIVCVLHKPFYWPKMKKDVQHICKKCITCRKAKSRI